jgi:hypothetical protein
VDERTIGLVIVVAGVAAIMIGLGVYAGAFGWFGRLPGDIKIESENVRVYMPLASMMLVSGVLTLVLYLLRRVF